MIAILHEIIRRCAAGERLALCTVVGSRGSTPQEKGAKMVVLTSGQTVGTLGGGCVEAEVRKQALELISAEQSKLLEFHLDHDYGWDDGLICGGVMDIYVQIIDANTHEPFLKLSSELEAEQSTEFRIKYEMQGAQREYVEPLGPPPTLVIAGAGHVGQALGALAHTLDFRITVIDDRADCASPARFPNARCIIGDIEQELSKLAIDPGTYIVIVTRGHRHDGHALAAVIDSPAKYIGLIGSKSKIKTIFDDLVAQGISPEKLLRVRAPIGLAIGAVTVPEIAVSIAAELIAARRGAGERTGIPMKIDSAQLSSWLARSKV